jgi:hypothetical protein
MTNLFMALSRACIVSSISSDPCLNMASSSVMFIATNLGVTLDCAYIGYSQLKITSTPGILMVVGRSEALDYKMVIAVF